MADEAPAAAAAPAEAAGTSAAAAAPAEAPAAEASAADSGGQPAAADSTAAAESSSVTTETTETQPSMLSSAEGNPPAQPAPSTEAPQETTTAKAAADQPKPAEEAKGALDPATKDATPKEAPAPLSITDLTLPEGVTLEAEGSKAFVDLMNNAELSAKDRAQGLIDLHKGEIERVYRQASDNQRRVWDDLNAGWRDQLRKDADIGGNRLHTSLSKAKGMIEEHLTPDDATALLRHVDSNGMGNFPPFIRLLVKLADRLNVFEDGIVASNPVPLRPQRGPGSRGWYDKG